MAISYFLISKMLLKEMNGLSHLKAGSFRILDSILAPKDSAAATCRKIVNNDHVSKTVERGRCSQ